MQSQNCDRRIIGLLAVHKLVHGGEDRFDRLLG
jgi:hypothetical protein